MQELTATACPAPTAARELLLEPLDPGSGRQPSGAERRDDFLDLGLLHVGSEKGDVSSHDSWLLLVFFNRVQILRRMGA